MLEHINISYCSSIFSKRIWSWFPFFPVVHSTWLNIFVDLYCCTTANPAWYIPQLRIFITPSTSLQANIEFDDEDGATPCTASVGGLQWARSEKMVFVERAALVWRPRFLNASQRVQVRYHGRRQLISNRVKARALLWCQRWSYT